jgi:hypothetical protein
MLDPAYSQLLDTNQELRSELRDEIFINKSNEKKIHILEKELEQCFRTISFQDKTIIAHEEEIESLKTEINSLKQHLQKTLQDLRHKGNASTSQDIHILRLEDKVERLKARIRILIDKKISINALDMATANLITNINRGLDRIENHIRGADTPLQNPFNILDGIRGSLNTIRATLQNITTERDQYQNILNDENRQVRDLRQQLNDSRNQNLRSQRLLDESRTQVERTAKEKDNAQGERDLAILAYNNERKESRRWYFSYRDKDRRVSELLREYFAFRLLIQRKNTQIAEHRRTAHRWTLRYNNDTERWRRAYADSQNRHLKWKGRYRNSQNQIQVQNQNIFNLQQQILVLQNNPLQNMAAIEHVMQMLAPHLASLPDYDGQEPPDTYYIKLRNINELARPMAVAGFDAVARTNNMKSKMIGRFHPVPAQNPYNGNNNIVTEAEFLNWLQGKYREVMIGTNRATLKALMSESFHPTDTPESYEKRIKPFVQGMVFADVLPYLYDHIPVNMQLRIRIANPANLNAFFTELRNIWLEAGGQVNIPIQPSYQASPQGVTSAEIEKLNSKIASLETQLAESMQVHSKLAQRLQLPENVVNSNNASIFDSYINQELEKRLGVIEINLAKLTKLLKEDIIDTKSAQYRYLESSDYNNGGLEKRLEQIEANLAKFARKDTRSAKTSQRQRLESSPFGGLEKRLDQIESLIAKLVKESKSRSGRVHTAIADEQSNPVFSDDDTPKPEDNDYSSDDSSTESDSRKRDMNVYITHEKKR